MNVKTSELEGAALDWAVAKCEGFLCDYNYAKALAPYSHNWNLAGPIIDREKIGVVAWGSSRWRAQSNWNEGYRAFVHVVMFEEFANTPLIAAMRCYVASKLGDEVEVPDELA